MQRTPATEKDFSIVFMGSPMYACPSLQACLDNPKARVIGVISRPDSKKGRGQHTSPSPVKTLALEYNVPTWTPTTKSDLDSIVKELNPDLIVVIAFGMILPPSITDHFLVVNLHGSLLPKYRGASPIQTALLDNESETGVDLIRMVEQLDAGPILARKMIPIDEDDDYYILAEKLSSLSATLLRDFLNQFPAIPEEILQNERNATFSRKIKTSDAELLESDSVDIKWGKIRAFSPKPGAYLFHKGKRVKLLKAKLESGKLIPLLVQPEGKAAMPYSSFQQGYGDLDVN